MKVQILVLMEALVHQSKNLVFSINFSESRTKFCLSLQYSGDNSLMFVSGKEISKFKVNNENLNFTRYFCLGSIFNGFGATESRDVFIKKCV